MKPKQIKKFLLSEIELLSNNLTDYIRNPGRDFSRNRKLPFSTIIKSIIGMGSKSLANELIDSFNTSDLPSASAFVQQRQKIKPEAFKAIFDVLSSGFVAICISVPSTARTAMFSFVLFILEQMGKSPIIFSI